MFRTTSIYGVVLPHLAALRVADYLRPLDQDGADGVVKQMKDEES